MMKARYKILSFIFCVMLVIASGSSVFAEENNEKISDTRKYLGETVYAGKSDGYSKKESLNKDNPHYGWKIGEFYVNGFTRVSDDSDNPIILKNVGDKVKLSFKLLQDIDKLNGKEGLSIGSDDAGYDEAFGIEKTDFGRGMLIIQKTNHQNQKEEPVLHKNYLKGVKLNVDTEVELCEEGDYEVALDYQISIDKGVLDYVKFWNQYVYDYRIHFKFSVRNGNCMVYPFDADTKAELTNTSITKNGFFLDFARSRYLDVDIKKQVLNEGASGLVEDTRFNKPASDGEVFKDEGVYIITAHNKYTDQTTEKTIYVGSNDLLKAYVTTGLQLDEIQKQLDNGATVNDDGIINYDTTNVPSNNNSGDNSVNSLEIENNGDITIDVAGVKSVVRNAVDFAKKYPVPVAVGAIVILVLVFKIKKKLRIAKEKRNAKKEEKRRGKALKKNKKTGSVNKVEERNDKNEVAVGDGLEEEE